MINLNRKYTEALEKSAQAKNRLANAEETIARHLGAFLRDERADPTQSAPPSKEVAQEKSPPKN